MPWFIDQIFVLFVFIRPNICFYLLLVLLIKVIPDGEYSNLAFSNTHGLYLKSSPVKYSYFSKQFLIDNAEILAASLLKWY